MRTGICIGVLLFSVLSDGLHAQQRSQSRRGIYQQLGLSNNTRMIRFRYELGSMKPKRERQGGMGMDMGLGMGMGADMGMGMAGGYDGDGSGAGLGAGGGFEDGGYGAGYGAGGDYGGEGGYGGGYGGEGYGSEGMYGGSTANSSRTITIYAYVLQDGTSEDRATVELLVSMSDLKEHRDTPGMGGYESYGGEEMESVEQTDRKWKDSLRRLKALTGSLAPREPAKMSDEELQIVSASIRQQIWKDDTVRAIHRIQSDAKALAAYENKLKGILMESYETQLQRQTLEVKQIEQRVAKLKEELERRRQAKQRVVDVQVGRIVLEAQGFLKN